MIWRTEAPRRGRISESKIAVVPEGIIWNLIGRDRIYQPFDHLLLFEQNTPYRLRVGYEVDVVLVDQVLKNPVCHENVLEPIRVHVEDQSSPTPVGGSRT